MPDAGADQSPFVDLDVDRLRPEDAAVAAPPVPPPAGANDPADDPNAPKKFVAGSKPTYERAQTVVIRRKRVSHVGAHGGAWKIAYADFVTAMMAFFLLMWLLTSTNHGTLQGIADYFNRPLQAAFTDGPGASATTSPQTDEQKQQQQKADERAQLESLKTRLTTLIDHTPKLQAYKNQIKIETTSEGLRVQIVDDKNRPMFDKGNDELKDYTRAILDQIGPTLNDVPNHISIAGHTDSLAYSTGASNYSNWELSSERANAARRELIAGGMNASKVLQVRGLADAIPLIPNEPANPANRRITIVVLNRDAEEQFRADGAATPDTNATPAP
jgi:chemotaxis protein MotB